MKKLILSIATLFYLGMTQTNAQVTATFKVDMSDVLTGGGTIAPVVSISGTFTTRGGDLPNWELNPMTDLGENVWAKTVTFTGPTVSTDSLLWQYSNGSDWENSETSIWSITNSEETSCMKLSGDFFNRKIMLPTDGHLIISAPYLKCHTITTDVKTILKGLQVLVGPNPTSSTLNIRFGGSAGSIIKLISVEGRVAKSIVTQQTSDFTHTIDVADLTAGIYYVTVLDGDRVYRTPVAIIN